MNTAVVDGGGISSHAPGWTGVDVSTNKSVTARAFDMTMRDPAENSQPGEQLSRSKETATSSGRAV